ncbi:MAG: C69 family dipeptidase [Lachnospiraceae bacterium]|jgi:dipeptidase|nr:C69 family dipeptidase [Lachnospiraceae bacterium]MEE3461345.1 C69 family dipeptidase [Lachnospiraceae bacterium]
MACTTILVGKTASYDGSTMIARNDDSGAGKYTPKHLVTIPAGDNKETVYRPVLSVTEIEVPKEHLKFTCMPDALKGAGIWAASGINECNVAMTATETITSNPRVQGADPLNFVYVDDDGKNSPSTADQIFGQPESLKASEKHKKPAGIGEEDMVFLVLPYVHTAREGILRLGSLLEKYGTYEMNGIGISDPDEIWWLETIGGHHWIAKRVPDDRYVIMPNQLGIDSFDLDDAYGDKKNHMCSADLYEFMKKYHLDYCIGHGLAGLVKEKKGKFNPRTAFGSHDDSDHIYNTPRAWYSLKYFNPHSFKWEGEDANYLPDSDDLPWSLKPEKKITVEDVKYVLSTHFQGTPYDPYFKPEIPRNGIEDLRGRFRSVGVNRNDFVAVLQLFGDKGNFKGYLNRAQNADIDKKDLNGTSNKAQNADDSEPFKGQSDGQAAGKAMSIMWFSFASNVFNALVPYLPAGTCVDDYFGATGPRISTDTFYWSERLIAALADASYSACAIHIERYQDAVAGKSWSIIDEYLESSRDTAAADAFNEKIAAMVKDETDHTLMNVLNETSNHMKNCFARSDA